VVWKATTSVGCGRTDCPGLEGLDPVNYLVVCQYYAAGNIVNPDFFAENVGELVSETLSVGFQRGVSLQRVVVAMEVIQPLEMKHRKADVSR
jgi:hypothetical protein